MIDWELQIQHPDTEEYIVVPFDSFTLEIKGGMSPSRASITLNDEAGYRFSWIESADKLKIYKNGMKYFYGTVLVTDGRFSSKGEEITIQTESYWHHILKRKLTTFERFGKLKNLNPTEIARVAIGIRTIVSESDWEADKIALLKYGTIGESLDTGSMEYTMGVQDGRYTMMAYLESLRWRVDEPEWQGSEEMQSVFTSVTENLGSGSSYYFFSRDDGETWYHLTKSASTNLAGSETIKNHGKYKTLLLGNVNHVRTDVASVQQAGDFRHEPSTQRVCRTDDGTLHTCGVISGTPTFLTWYRSVDNGATWNAFGAVIQMSNDINDFCIATTPDGDVGFLAIDTTGVQTFHNRTIKTKVGGDWTWNAGGWTTSNFAMVTSPQGLSMRGIKLYDGSSWKEYFVFTIGCNTNGMEVGAIRSGVTGLLWNVQLGTATNDIAVLWAERNWGAGASSKRVMCVARAGRYGSTRACEIKYATYSEGVTPVWSSSWITIDSGACRNVDIVTNRLRPNRTSEPFGYNIHVFYERAGNVQCKYSAMLDLSTWTVMTVGLPVLQSYWDVEQLMGNNFLLYRCRYDGTTYNDLVVNRWDEGTEAWNSDTVIEADFGSAVYLSPSCPQESVKGYGECVSTVSTTTTALKCWLLYSSTAPSVTGMMLTVITDSETGILEGNMTAYTNSGLDAEEIDYQMNRESRLSMLDGLQKAMPMAIASPSPYPFWDIALREVGDVCYLDIDEELGVEQDVTLSHPDEAESDMDITALSKTVDRSEIINALTLVGGGWSQGGISVIPTKNVATDEVQAGTTTQFAGTIVNKRVSTDLTIENIAFSILNITRNPRISITLNVTGDARDLFSPLDRITVISERYGIDQTLKVMEMVWGVSNSGSKLTLALDNGSRTLERYMVEIVSNMKSLGYDKQGATQRPPIYLSSNFSKDEPAILKFYVPSNKQTTKAVVHIKTEQYVSSEGSAMSRFAYYPANVKLYIDDIMCDGFGMRGAEDTPVSVEGLDITMYMDTNEDGLIDKGEHSIRISASASTNNPSALGRVELYLVLEESEG